MAARDESVSINNFKRAMSVPVYKDACILKASPNMYIIHSSFRVHDLDKMEKCRSTKSIFLTRLGNEVAGASMVQDCTSALLTEYNRETLQRVILKRKENCGKSCIFIEVWNKDTHCQTFSTCNIKVHGEIYHSGHFSSVRWNPGKSNTILYVAEKTASEPCISQEQNFKKDKDVYSDDWGEMHDGQRSSVLCTMDVDTGDVSVLPIFEDMDLTLGQAIWINEDAIAFIAWDEKPFRLGILHCMNRRSTLYYYELASDVARRISDGSSSVRSPRVSPDSNRLVYLQNSIGGPHKKGSCLMMYNMQTLSNETVLNIVEEASASDFPGIYTNELPSHCWTTNSQFVIFSSYWRSVKVILAVDVHSGSIEKLKIPCCTGSCDVLDVYDDIIIANVSAIDVEPLLVSGKITFDESGLHVDWHVLDPDTPKQIVELNFSVYAIDPEIKHETFHFLDYEMILVTPNHTDLLPALILWPHGGPHGVFCTEFSMYAAAFVLEGFSVCMVNYRGSIGFGENCLNSLIGKIGVQDVADVHQAGILAVEKLSIIHGWDIDVFLFGGSHGGFIIPHLCAQFQGYYKACVCRNPVINLPGMIEGTDIPDWVWEESGLGSYDQNFYTKQCPDDMWKMSPLCVAEKVNVPTLILLGKNDRRVPPSQGLAYYRVLKSRGIRVRLSMYDCNHALDSTVATSQSMYQSCRFFRENASFKIP